VTTPDDAHSAPTLETRRLCLRVHSVSDFEDCAAMWSDPQVMRYLSGRRSREKSRGRAPSLHWALAIAGFGFWVVREKTTGRFVGEVGLADLRRDLQPSIDGAPEIGWVLSPWAHGNGFCDGGRECGARMDSYALWTAANGLYYPPRNSASLSVAQNAASRNLRARPTRTRPSSCSNECRARRIRHPGDCDALWPFREFVARHPGQRDDGTCLVGNT